MTARFGCTSKRRLFENKLRTLRLGRLTTFLLLAITAAGLPGCDEKDPTGTDLTTSSDGGQIAAPAEDTDGDSMALASGTAALVSTIPLPINQSKATCGVLFGPHTDRHRPGRCLQDQQHQQQQGRDPGATNGGGGTVVSSVAVHGISRAPRECRPLRGDQRRQLQARTHCQGQPPGIAGELISSMLPTTIPALEAASLGTGAAAVFDSRNSVATLRPRTPAPASPLSSAELGPARPRGC